MVLELFPASSDSPLVCCACRNPVLIVNIAYIFTVTG